MSRDVLTVGSTMRIPLLYRGEYSQWVERFMNYLKEQTDGEAMINLIKNGDQPLPRVTQVSIAGITSTEQPPLKDKSMWSDQEKRVQKIDHLARSLLIQRLSNDIYSLIDSNKTAKDLWDALARHMLGSEYGEQDRKAAVLYEYETFKATEGELLLDTYIRYLQNKNLMDINIDALYNILKQNQEDVNDAMGSKKKTVVVTFDPLAFIAEKTNSANKKQEFVKTDNKRVEKKDDEKKKDMSKVKCYNYKKEGSFTKDCKKAKVKDYEYYKTKMLLTKKDKDEQVLMAEDQAWMESSSDSDQEINANMVFMAQIEKVLSDFEPSSSSADEKISEIAKQQVLYDKMSVQLVELDKHVTDLKNTALEKEFKISKLKECVRNKDLELEKCLERLNVYENKLHKMGQTNQTVHMTMPSKDNLYNGRKGISFENPSYFEKPKDLRPTLYDEKVISLGYTMMFLTHSDEALEIEKFKKSRENKIEFAYDYENLNASYVNEKINLEDDYFQEIINPDFDKIDSSF
nr:hypothetical protein [Tanacetum cinerariifolium]